MNKNEIKNFVMFYERITKHMLKILKNCKCSNKNR